MEELYGPQTLDFSDIQRLLDTSGYEIEFETLVTDMMSGRLGAFFGSLRELLVQALCGEVLSVRDIFVQLLMLAVISAVLTNFSSVFHSSGISDTAFYITYLVCIGMLTAVCALTVDIAVSYVGLIVKFVQALLPVYTLTLIFTGTATSASLYYETILAVVSITQLLIKEWLIPLIQFYVFMNFAGQLSDKDWLSKAVELIESFTEWIYKSLFAAFIGVQSIQKIILPAIDDTTKGLISKSVSAIPGFGNTAEAVSSLMIGSAVLIRNGVGVAGMVVISVIFLVPAVKIALILGLLRLLAALVQPICDKKLVNCISRTGNAVKMLLKAVLFTGMLNFITVAVICMSGGGT